MVGISLTSAKGRKGGKDVFPEHAVDDGLPGGVGVDYGRLYDDLVGDDNDDTFGDVAVGDDWEPSVAQDAFERERQKQAFERERLERRAAAVAAANAAASTQKTTAPPKSPLLGGGVAAPPGLEEGLTAASPCSTRHSPSVAPFPGPPLPTGLLSSEAPCRGFAAPLPGAPMPDRPPMPMHGPLPGATMPGPLLPGLPGATMPGAPFPPMGFPDLFPQWPGGPPMPGRPPFPWLPPPGPGMPGTSPGLPYGGLSPFGPAGGMPPQAFPGFPPMHGLPGGLPPMPGMPGFPGAPPPYGHLPHEASSSVVPPPGLASSGLAAGGDPSLSLGGPCGFAGLSNGDLHAPGAPHPLAPGGTMPAAALGNSPAHALAGFEGLAHWAPPPACLMPPSSPPVQPDAIPGLGDLLSAASLGPHATHGLSGGRKKVMSVAELEAQLHGVAPPPELPPLTAALPELPGQMPLSHSLSPLNPLTSPANLPEFYPPPLPQAFHQDLASDEFDDDEDEMPAPSIVAPFTKAHLELLRSSPPGVPIFALQQFMCTTHEKGAHPRIMTGSDKELIVRIQLSQMAAMGAASVQNYRGTFTHRVKKAEEEAQARQVPASPAGLCVLAKLKDVISRTGLPQDDERAPQPDPSGQVAQEVTPSSPSQSPASPDSELGSESGSNASPSGKRKFGGPLYGSVYHPRKNIDFHTAKDVSITTLNPSDAAVYWRTQLIVERTYSIMLDIEQILSRTFDCHPLDVEKHGKLVIELEKALDCMTKQLFEQNASADTSGTPAPEQDLPLLRLLGLRKGRVVLRRLLLGLAPSQDQPSERSATNVMAVLSACLWRLATALLAVPGLALKLAKDGTAEDASWHRLGWSLAQSMAATCTQPLAPPEQTVECSQALAALLEGHSGGQMTSLCSFKVGVALLRCLIDGCGRTGERVCEAAECVLSSLIEELCGTLPQLYEVASSSSPSVIDSQRLGQEDLWGLLISVTERASAAQKRRIHEVIGPFVGEITTST